MITDDQWQALHLFVTEHIKTKDTFGLTDLTLEQDFGITHPFWEQMCKYAQLTERTYTGDPQWPDSTGEPTEIMYRRKNC